MKWLIKLFKGSRKYEDLKCAGAKMNCGQGWRKYIKEIGDCDGSSVYWY